MCGITLFWNREGNIHQTEYLFLMEGAADRGNDGFGIIVYDVDTDTIIYYAKHTLGFRNIPFRECSELAELVCDAMNAPNRIFLMHCRATPETEHQTTREMLQPIIHNKDDYHRTILAHNGSVSDFIVKELREKSPERFKTGIDSEAIQVAYYNRGSSLKSTMEYLVGAFAFVLIDRRTKFLHLCTGFNPLAHMYIRGKGYFIHSDIFPLNQVLRNVIGLSTDGMNVWESWYHHYIDGYTIISTDLDSGFQFKENYSPRFVHPHWETTDYKWKHMDPFEKQVKDSCALVVCSGGVDSSLTAALLTLSKMDVKLIHFNYGAKSQDCETWAVRQLAHYYDLELIEYDLTNIYNTMSEYGMLTDKNVPISSGGDHIKSTIAWVPGRNAVFASLVMAKAEHLILSKAYNRVYIAAGWSQLSEETGGYPDNSFQFNSALNNLKKYGYITGKFIEFLPVLQNITKTEAWALGGAINFPFELTVSCDNPIMSYKGYPLLCPLCGSTYLSTVAADRAGVKDNRHFTYTPNYRGLYQKDKNLDVYNIIERLVLPDTSWIKLTVAENGGFDEGN